MSRPSSNTINKNPPSSSSSSLTPAAPTGWSVSRPSAVRPLDDDDDFFGVRSRTVKAAGILKDLKASADAPRSARPSLEVRMNGVGLVFFLPSSEGGRSARRHLRRGGMRNALRLAFQLFLASRSPSLPRKMLILRH